MATVFDSKPKTTTSTNQMFPKLEQGWVNALDAAGTAFGSARLPEQAPLNRDIKQAFLRTGSLAHQGVPNLDQMYATQAGILGSGGMTAGMQDASALLRGVATAQPGGNPYLHQQLDINANRAANAAATRFGGGRYGSAGIGTGVGTAVSEANNGLLAQAYENDMNRSLAAMGQMGSLAQAGAGNMNTAMAMSPMMNELRYDGASRQAGIGQYMQDRTQGRIDQKANFPWSNLNNYVGILGGMGNQGSTQVTKTPGPSAAQSIIGGIGGGAKLGSAFGPWGTLIGGALGGTAGAFA